MDSEARGITEKLVINCIRKLPLEAISGKINFGSLANDVFRVSGKIFAAC